MSGRDQLDAIAAGALLPQASHRVGELVALAQEGRVAVIRDLSRPGAALLQARSVVDLHAGHIGQQVLVTDAAAGNDTHTVVLGVLRGAAMPPVAHEDAAGKVGMEVDVDGERLLVEAQHQLVLKCGKASITLTRAGKVLINGTYVVSRSSGVHRIKGGSVQLN